MNQSLWHSSKWWAHDHHKVITESALIWRIWRSMTEDSTNTNSHFVQWKLWVKSFLKHFTGFLSPNVEVQCFEMVRSHFVLSLTQITFSARSTCIVCLAQRAPKTRQIYLTGQKTFNRSDLQCVILTKCLPALISRSWSAVENAPTIFFIANAVSGAKVKISKARNSVNVVPNVFYKLQVGKWLFICLDICDIAFNYCREFSMATGILKFLVVALLAVTLSNSHHNWQWQWQRPDLGPVPNDRADRAVVVLGMINSGCHQNIWWQADCRVKAIEKMDQMRQDADARYL